MMTANLANVKKTMNIFTKNKTSSWKLVALPNYFELYKILSRTV
jgi:hypothetical protein